MELYRESYYLLINPRIMYVNKNHNSSICESQKMLIPAFISKADLSISSLKLYV